MAHILILALGLLACGDKDDDTGSTTDGGSADGGSADGGSADGGSADGGSADGGSSGDGGSEDGGSELDCELTGPPLSISSGEDVMQARSWSYPNMGELNTVGRDLNTQLWSLAAELGTPYAELCDELSFSEGTNVYDGGEGCLLEGEDTSLLLTGRAEVGPTSWIYDDFSVLILGGRHESYLFEANGEVIYDTDSDPQRVDAVLDYRLEIIDDVEIDSKHLVLDTVYLHGGDDPYELGTGTVDVLESSGGVTGSFCIVYDMAYLPGGTCDEERDRVGTITIQGDALGVLSFDADTACDSCAAFSLDGTVGEPYCL